MKRNKASNKATRVARYTRQIASAVKAIERPGKNSRLKRLFGRQNELPQEPSCKLLRASKFCDTLWLTDYVDYVIGNMNRDAGSKALAAPRRASRFDFALRCLDEVPRIH